MISQIPRVAFNFFPPALLIVLALITVIISYMIIRVIEIDIPEGIYNSWLEVKEKPNSVAL